MLSATGIRIPQYFLTCPFLFPTASNFFGLISALFKTVFQNNIIQSVTYNSLAIILNISEVVRPQLLINNNFWRRK